MKFKKLQWKTWQKWLAAWSLVLLGGLLFFGGKYLWYVHQENPYGVNLTNKQQVSFVKALKKGVTNNWRPADVQTQMDKKYHNFNHKNQQQLLYLLYRSQQNTALYYNSFLYALQAEFAYYQVDDQKDPLHPQVDSQVVPGVLHDMRANHEIVEYLGAGTYTALPDFHFLNYHYDPQGDFAAFLKIAQVEAQDPIFKRRQVNIFEANKRLTTLVRWAYYHQNSEFYLDALSLAKCYYLTIFNLNNNFHLVTKNGKTYITSANLKDLQVLSKMKKQSLITTDVKHYLQAVQSTHDELSPATKTSYQTLANSKFGDSVFDNNTNALAGAPKTKKQPVDTDLYDQKTMQSRDQTQKRFRQQPQK